MVIKAFVVPRRGHELGRALVKALQDYVKRKGLYKYPRQIEFVDDLPKTASGKLRCDVLRGREVGR